MKATMAVAVVAMLGVSVALVVPASSQTTGRTQLHVYEVEKGYSKVIDEGRKGLSAGDLIVENLPVFDAATNARVGDTATVITVIRGPKDNPFVWIDCEAGLAGGSITFAGGERMADIMEGSGATLSVTGGTGAYRDATGTVKVTHKDRDGQATVDFDFDVVL